MKKKTLFFLWISLLLLVMTPAYVLAEPAPEYFLDEAKLPFDPLPGLEAEQLWGVHQGAGYRIEVPAAWNGALVMWVHGYRSSDEGVELELTVDNPPIRAWLLAQGYAWAASSFSKNNYDVTVGAQDTHALTKLFNGLIGKPHRVYIAGVSMGGHVIATMIEQWPKTYAGALPMCGVLGDYALFDYLLDFNVVSQALVGVQAQYPPSDDFLSATVPLVKANLEVIPGTFPFTLNTQGQSLAAAIQQQTGGQRPLFDQGFLFWNGVVPGDFLFGLGTEGDIMTRVRGVAVDNVERVYQFDADPALTPQEAALNDAVLRVARDHQARHPNGLTNVPAVSGEIQIPVLTLHTLGDLFVPVSMEQIYAARVAAHGASDRLVQRAIRDLGHCAFTGDEIITAFADLVNWVENGIKPAGDDFLDPAAVADPEFGCAFTSVDRDYPPPLRIPACSSKAAQAASTSDSASTIYLPVVAR